MAGLDTLMVSVVILHAWICPYTKVEESFNTQAIHDILYHGADINKYDHHEFPGVVPRTFLGPLFIAALSYPMMLVSHLFNFNKLGTQLIVRTVLGLVVAQCFKKYRHAVGHKYGKNIATWLSLITLTQFHLLFYASRPLPNIFGLACVLLCLSFWLRGQYGSYIWTGALGILVFRAELALLLGPILLVELVQRRLGLGKLIIHGTLAALCCLSLSIVLDSWFWQRWLWPEGEVLWFNTVLNKSSEWGTSPYLWYVYSALPRGLLTSFLLVPLAWCLDTQSRPITVYATIYVMVYAILPHKELRFIIYVFPIFNTVAAMTCSKLWEYKRDSIYWSFLALCVVGHLAANIILTGTLTYISHRNYPGGYAIQRLHQRETPDTYVNVHIDVATAQTGVSRFTQLHEYWRYDKTEGLISGSRDMMVYTHLMVGASSPQDPIITLYAATHNVLEVIGGFAGISLNFRKFPPIKITLEPKIFILRKTRTAAYNS